MSAYTGINTNSINAVLTRHKLAIEESKRVRGNNGPSSNNFNEFGVRRPVFGPVEPSEHLKLAMKVTAKKLPPPSPPPTPPRSITPVVTPPPSRPPTARQRLLSLGVGTPVSIGAVGTVAAHGGRTYRRGQRRSHKTKRKNHKKYQKRKAHRK